MGCFEGLRPGLVFHRQAGGGQQTPSIEKSHIWFETGGGWTTAPPTIISHRYCPEMLCAQGMS